jgi:rhamnose utilization protein RhaD (predicted bifunctional aldolase and dehydrogenase)
MKEIAANLRKAASERQREINDLRSNVSIKESEMKSQINSIESTIQRNKVDLIEHTQQTPTVVANSASIRHQKQQIKNIEKDFQQYRTDVDRIIKSKESDINKLNREAGDFESRASYD